jgi:beta-lactam-binding protein with PASTA domain
MRTCQSCGKENPADRDFCSCGEYLRWEPTGFVQAITPEMAAEAAAQASPPKPEPGPPAAPPPPPAARVTPAAPVTPGGGNGHGNGHSQPPAPPAPPAPPPPTIGSLPAISKVPPGGRDVVQPPAKTLVRGAVPAQPLPGAPQPNEPATIVLRLPEGDPAKGETLHQAVEPGQRERVLALVRNQSGIVDNYDLRVEGMPQDWWSIYPGTVYLVPFGAGGTYEQEVEVHLHPPRGPEAEARVWELQIVADSKAQRTVAASAPLALHIEPYIETATTLRPQRKKGRRKATFDVTVANRANAPVLIALDGEDPDGELQFGFNRPPQEIPAGAAVTSQMQVKPPKQIWIGRPQDRRLEVKTVSGEEAAARAAAEPLSAEVLAQAPEPGKRKWYKRRAPQIPGVYGPRIYKPQLYPPDVSMGPGGLNVRMPQFRAPQIQGPRMGQMNASQLAKPGALKLPGRGGPATPAAPLLPTQGVFRQKSWLPWWLIPLLALLLLLLFLILRSLPSNVIVPKVTGEASAFNAEKKLTNADLKLDPNKKEALNDKATPGTILEQTPAAGTKVEKGTPVAILVSVKSGKKNVPNIVGLTASDAEKALRAKDLTLGQASPQPVDPKGKISSQIPAAGEVVKAGTPVNIFYPDPADAANKKKQKDKGDGKGAAGGAGGGGAGGGAAAAADIVVPAIDGAKLDAYAKKAADLGIVPVVAKKFNDAPPGTPFATEPPGGTKVAAKSKLRVLVSVGQPQVVYTNGKNILRVNGATGGKLDPVASSPEDEEDPTWAADGEHVAYTADGRVMLKDLTKKNSAAVPLTKAGDKFENLAWAPTADKNLIAMNDVSASGDTDLCLGNIKTDGTDVNCLKEPSFAVIRHLHWSTDGRTILGVGVKLPAGTGVFGIVRWRVKKDKPAFSADTADWNKGRFLTDLDTPGKGVLDAEVSPDGKRLALVSNQGSSSFRLWIADDPEDFAVLTRVPINSVRTGKELNAAGDDPSFQPLTIGG